MSQWKYWMRRFLKWNSAQGAIAKTIRRLMMGLAAFAAASAPQWAAADKVTAKLTVQDVLAMPGRAVTLEARLATESLIAPRSLGGEQLEFHVAGKKAGTAMTGADGRAFFEFTPRMRGNL